MDAIIGNISELSCEEASPINSTEVAISTVLSSIFSLDLSRVSSNPSISNLRISSSVEVAFKMEFKVII